MLLAAPSASTIASWKEDRRVFYVGASRAETLLVLFVPKSRLKRMAAVFSKKGISCITEVAS